MAVARRRDARSLGLDAERVIPPERAGGIARVVVGSDDPGAAASLPHHLYVTLAFSIKEATFKCLYPIVRRRFYYDALRVAEIDATAGTFLGELTRHLGDGFAAGRVIQGRWTLADDHVCCGIVLPAD